MRTFFIKKDNWTVQYIFFCRIKQQSNDIIKKLLFVRSNPKFINNFFRVEPVTDFIFKMFINIKNTHQGFGTTKIKKCFFALLQNFDDIFPLFRNPIIKSVVDKFSFFTILLILSKWSRSAGIMCLIRIPGILILLYNYCYRQWCYSY